MVAGLQDRCVLFCRQLWCASLEWYVCCPVIGISFVTAVCVVANFLFGRNVEPKVTCCPYFRLLLSTPLSTTVVDHSFLLLLAVFVAVVMERRPNRCQHVASLRKRNEFVSALRRVFTTAHVSRACSRPLLNCACVHY